MAAVALRQGDTALAARLADGLLQADRTDPTAHFVLAHAQERAGQPRAALGSAARAYRFAEDGPERFAAGQVAARLALQADRYMLAQIWLRRTALHLPDDAAREALARDYALLRRLNPWHLSLQTDLRRSSNVNNGADSALQIIDGVPVVGRLDGAAQALSGAVFAADLGLSYRLAADARSATHLKARFYARRVALSDEAQALAPAVTNSDFASDYAEAGLRHAFALGGGSAALSVAAGAAVWGDRTAYRLLRAGAERSWTLGEDRQLLLAGSVERRDAAASPAQEADIYALTARYVFSARGEYQAALALGLRQTDAELQFVRSRSASLRMTYALGQPVGPVRLSAGLTLGWADYPHYRSGIIAVPGGRQDLSAEADVTMIFEGLERGGFAPSLRISAARAESNVSRFDTSAVSVSLGIRSTF